jgi:hypothetical protein
MIITVIENCASIALPYKPLKSCAVVQTALPFCVKPLTFFALVQTALPCGFILFLLWLQFQLSCLLVLSEIAVPTSQFFRG